jgi:hydrogenase maturation protease
MTSVVIGLGSPFLSDDSIGPRVVRELARQGLPGARLVEAHAGGLALVEEMVGAERVVVVDATLDVRQQLGAVVVTGVGSTSLHGESSHDCTLEQALAVGRALGLAIPDDDRITLVTIAVQEIHRFDELLSPVIAAALPHACATVMTLLAQPDRAAAEVGHA